MSSLSTESAFFHDISQKVIDLVKSRAKDTTIAKHKGARTNYATQLDIDVENLIVDEINRLFPGDAILAEEQHSDTVIPDTRIWLIDPICGTSNLGKRLDTYCCNIALADKKQVIASCVVDPMRREYIWSVGNNEVFVNEQPLSPSDANTGVKIDVDLGSVRNVNPEERQVYYDGIVKLLENTDFDLISFNSSLGEAYVATGKLDGFIHMYTNPWDIAAASFLIQQVGGIITAKDGSVWSLETPGAIIGRTPEIHQKLLSAFNPLKG